MATYNIFIQQPHNVTVSSTPNGGVNIDADGTTYSFGQGRAPASGDKGHLNAETAVVDDKPSDLPTVVYDSQQGPDVKVYTPDFGQGVPDVNRYLKGGDVAAVARHTPSGDDGDEVDEMFKSEWSRQTTSTEEMLQKGRDAGDNKGGNFLTKKGGGGYLTAEQLVEQRKEHEQNKARRLSHGDELELIQRWRHLEGMNLKDALIAADKEGYSLHILYVDNGPKQPRVEGYSGTTLGIRIHDPDFGASIKGLQGRARVEEIIDVGGLDEDNRGVN